MSWVNTADVDGVFDGGLGASRPGQAATVAFAPAVIQRSSELVISEQATVQREVGDSAIVASDGGPQRRSGLRRLGAGVVRALPVLRVLGPGGVFLFNVWDTIKTNEFADVVTEAVGGLFPDDPPLFLARTPHGYFDEAEIQEDLAAAGFETPAGFEALEERSRSESCEIPALAYCQGTPLRNEIEARDPSRLEEATTAAAEAFASRYGRRDVDGRIRGYVVTARKR